MTLYNTDPQYREEATQWKVFSMLPLYVPLAGGRILRWFAVNLPMDLGTGGHFTSDIDILAKLRNPRGAWVYLALEVKVALLARDGSVRSLKESKSKSLLRQLKAYRAFGCPDVSLLDVYICESGFLQAQRFPTPDVHRVAGTRVAALDEHGFGYALLPFRVRTRC
jgi:hypothetical protein